MVETVKRLWRRVARTFAAARRRYGWLDHFARAAIRYDQVRGGRLAAAVTYHGFLAVFPLLLLAYAVLGYLVGRDTAFTAEVSDFLASYLPTLDVERIAGSRYTAGLIGLVGVLYAGLGWVDTLRSAIRLIWERRETPGNPVLARVVDVGVLIGLGLVFAVSIAVSAALNFGVGWGLEQVGITSWAFRTTVAIVGFLVGVLVNVGVFVALLVGLPRLRMPFARLIMPVLIGAVAFELLKTFSAAFLRLTITNPAYTVVGSAAGLLVFINLLNQLLLFCAALTATSEKGEVIERPALSVRRAELRDDAARRASVDAPTPAGLDEASTGGVG